MEISFDSRDPKTRKIFPFGGCAPKDSSSLFTMETINLFNDCVRKSVGYWGYELGDLKGFNCRN